MKDIVIANLKMNLLPSATKSYLIELVEKTKQAKCEVVVCLPFTSLDKANRLLEGTHIKLGAQNVHYETCGAYTGEISAEMLKDFGVEYVLVGHSERRKMFSETNSSINKKLKTVLSKGLKAVFCIGETLVEKERGLTSSVLKKQIETALSGLYENELGNIVFAYEPVWAIGTGVVASEKQIEETIKEIRTIISADFSKIAGKNAKIVYGGSIKKENAKKIFALSVVNGGLVGGASNNASDFREIIFA